MESCELSCKRNLVSGAHYVEEHKMRSGYAAVNWGLVDPKYTHVHGRLMSIQLRACTLGCIVSTSTS